MMRMLAYHKRLPAAPLERAAGRSKMLRKTRIWDVLLILVTGIGGPVLHLYAPVIRCVPWMAVLVPVNESVWEHLKLLYFPAVSVMLLRYLFTGELQRGILTTFASGLWRAMLLMICGFYTVSGILGALWLPADIGLFYVCMIYMVIYLRRHADRQRGNNLPGVLLLLLMAAGFVYFTYFPPEIGLFTEI